MPEIVGTLKPPRLAAAPSSPVKGQMYFNSTDNTLYWWDGTKWVASGGGSTPPEVYIGTAAPTRNQEVLWVDTDEAPPAVTRDINMDTWHVVGAAGEPAFGDSLSNVAGNAPTAFRKFPDGNGPDKRNDYASAALATARSSRCPLVIDRLRICASPAPDSMVRPTESI